MKWRLHPRACFHSPTVLILAPLLLIAGIGLASTLPVQAGAIPLGNNVVITDAGLNGDSVETPALAMHGNTLYAVWGDARDDDTFDSFRQVYLSKSTDGGKTWEANVRVGKTDYDSWIDHPQIAVAPDGTVWVAWYLFYKPGSNQTNEIRIAKSTDGGQTFAIQSLLTDYPDAEDRWLPHIAVDETTGNLILLYNEYWTLGDSTGYYIYATVFDAQLQVLSQVTVNDSPRSGRIGAGTQDNSVPTKSLVVRNGKICAAWEDQRERFAIWGACSTDGGATFGANFVLSGPDAIHPHLAIGPDGTLYALFTYQTDARKNLILRASSDNGATWGEPVQVTKVDSLEVTSYDLAVDANGQLVVGWIHEVSVSSTDLYLSTSLDKGANWSLLAVEDGTGQFPNSADQRDVALIVGGSGEQTTAHLAWEDDRNSTDEIYGASFVLDGVPPTAPTALQATSGDTSIVLNWTAATDSTGIRGYRIYRATNEAGPYTEITPRLVDKPTYRDVGLDTTTYFYKVAAVDNTANTGPQSGMASAAAQISTDLPVNGLIAYSVNKELRVRDFADFGMERSLGAGTRPRFSPDATTIYHGVTGTISAKSVSGGDARVVYVAENLFDDYDIASFDPVDNANNEKYLAAIIGRSLVQVGGGLCFTAEPHYLVSTEKRYVDDYNYSSDIALSAFPQWMLFRYTGFCNAAASGSTTPGDLCIVNLTNNEQKCMEGANYREPDFAPARGDNRVVFAAPFTGQQEIWTAEVAENGDFINYTQLTRGAQGIESRAPNWSSDGNWIIFVRDMDPSQLETLQLHIVRADGASLRNLGISGSTPAWTGGGSAPPVDLPEKIFLPTINR